VLSVIIATYNKRDHLEWTLRGLARQRNCAAFEVVVAVDGSTDGTLELLDEAQGWNAAWQSLEVAALGTNGGRAAARNEALRRARGSYILCLDDDAVPSDVLVADHQRIAQSADGPVATIGRLRHLVTSALLEPGDDGTLIDHLRDAPAPVAKSLNAKLAELGYSGEVPADFYFDRPRNTGLDQLSWSHDFYDRWLSLIPRRGIRQPWVSFATNHAGFSSSLIESVGNFDEGFSGWGEEDAELGYRMFREGCQYTVSSANAYNRQHPRDLRREWCEWVPNYERFVEKYDRPFELVMRWKLIMRQLTGPEFESTLRKASQEEKVAAEGEYERFVAAGHRNPELVVDWFVSGTVPDLAGSI
jgi:glycosyltransferase involved in cell wall biosynthesis